MLVLSAREYRLSSFVSDRFDCAGVKTLMNTMKAVSWTVLICHSLLVCGRLTFFFWTSPLQRAPHPCVLCRGGNHRPTSFDPYFFNSRNFCGPPSHKTRKDGAPPAVIASAIQRLGRPPSWKAIARNFFLALCQSRNRSQ